MGVCVYMCIYIYIYIERERGWKGQLVVVGLEFEAVGKRGREFVNWDHVKVVLLKLLFACLTLGPLELKQHIS